MLKQSLFFGAIALSIYSSSAVSQSCPNDPEAPCVNRPAETDAFNLIAFASSTAESNAAAAISALTATGFTKTKETNSYDCDFGGPIYTKQIQLCVQGRVSSFYNTASNQVAFICEVNALGATVSVNVICQVERLASDPRPPAKIVEGGVVAAFTQPANIAVGRRIFIEANAISAGISVVTSHTHRP